MKNERSNKLHISKSAAIGCLVAVAAVTCITAGMYIKENKADEKNESVYVNNKNSKLSIDSKTKYYSDFEKCEKVVGFNFKVPDYAADGVIPDSFVDVMKTNNSEQYVKIDFEDENKSENIIGEVNVENYNYSLGIFKNDPKDLYKNIFKDTENSTIEVTSCEKTLGDIKGEDITITQKSEGYADYGMVINAFAWKDEDVYYSIVYNEKFNFSDDYKGEKIKLSEEELIKIISSMTKPQDVKNIKYFEPDKNGYKRNYIYDDEDLENECKDLKFTPNVIESINDNLSLSEVYVENFKDGKPEFNLQYFSNDYDVINLKESNNSDEFNDYKSSKSSFKLRDDCKESKFEKINIDSKDVYKIIQESDDDREYVYLYAWEENGIYYKLQGEYYKDSYDVELEKIISDILKVSKESN